VWCAGRLLQKFTPPRQKEEKQRIRNKWPWVIPRPFPPPPPTKETFIKKEFKNKSHRVLIVIQRRVSGGSLLRPLVPPGEKNSLLEKRVTHPPLLSPPNSHVTTVSGPRKKTQLFMSTRTRARPLHPSLTPLARRLLYIYQRLGSLEQRSGRSPPFKSSGWIASSDCNWSVSTKKPQLNSHFQDFLQVFSSSASSSSVLSCYSTLQAWYWSSRSKQDVLNFWGNLL